MVGLSRRVLDNGRRAAVAADGTGGAGTAADVALGGAADAVPAGMRADAPAAPAGAGASGAMMWPAADGSPGVSALSDLIRAWPLPGPGWGRGLPAEFVHHMLGEIADRVGRLEDRLVAIQAELGFLQQVLSQRDWELDQQRYAAQGPAWRGPAGDERSVDAAMTEAVTIIAAARRSAAAEADRAARSVRAAHLYAHVITMRALRGARRAPHAQHVAALETELAYRTAQLSAVKEHVVAAAAAACFGGDVPGAAGGSSPAPTS